MLIAGAALTIETQQDSPVYLRSKNLSALYFVLLSPFERKTGVFPGVQCLFQGKLFMLNGTLSLLHFRFKHKLNLKNK